MHSNIEIKSKTHLNLKPSNQTQENQPKWTKLRDMSKWSYHKKDLSDPILEKNLSEV